MKHAFLCLTLFSSLIFLTHQAKAESLLNHSSHHERFQEAKAASKALNLRYEHLKIEAEGLSLQNCPKVSKRQNNAEKTVQRIEANAIHYREGQSILHLPTKPEIQSAAHELDLFSEAVAACKAHQKPASAP